MEELYQLLPLLKRNRAAELLGSGSEADKDGTLLQRFFALLSSGRTYSENEIAEQLYGKGHSASSPAFQKLKHKLKYRLLNFVLLMDHLQPDYTSPERAIKTIHREMAVAKIVAFSHRSRRLAISLLRKVCKRAAEFEVTDVCAESARYLANLYGLERDARQRQHFSDVYRKYREIETDKQFINETYADMLAMYRLRSDAEIIAFLDTRLAEVRRIVKRSEVVSILYGGRLILQSYYQLTGRTDELIRNDDKAISALMSRPGTTAAHVTAFRMSRAQALAQRRDFTAAFAELTSILDALDEGSRNYHKVIEIGMTLSLNGLDFERAENFYARIDRRTVSAKISQGAYEHLIILEAYLQFAAEAGLFTPTTDRITRFKLSRFKNEIAKISSQKDGFNLHVYLVEWIFLLLRRRYDLIFDREEAFTKYLSRYVDRKKTPRRWAFGKLLLQIPKSNFHAVKVCNDGRRFLKVFRGSGETSEEDVPYPSLEILPFSVIWGSLLSRLKGYEFLEDAQRR